MAHSYSQNHIHLVFSTKDRAKLISKELQPKLWAYVAAICKNQGMPAFPFQDKEKAEWVAIRQLHRAGHESNSEGGLYQNAKRQ
jgi:hypothetical protein